MDQNGFAVTRCSTPSISGKGEDILTIFLFLSRKSKTVRSSGAFFGLCGFGISSIGMVFLAVVILHHPDFN